MLRTSVTLAVVVIVSVLLLPSAGAAPAITALAPFEVWADGFDDVRGIVVDDAGGVFVADHHRGTIAHIAADHTQSVVARGLDRPQGLVFDAAERLLVAEEGAGRVLRLEPGGSWTVLVAGLKQPRWLAVGLDGTIFASARRLTRHATVEADDDDTEPQVIVALPPSGPARVFADGLRRVEGLAFGDGALFVATRGRRDSARATGVVLRIPVLPDGSAGPVGSIGPDDSYKMPMGLVRDTRGNVWLTAHDVVMKLRMDGTLARFAAALGDPQGLAFDADGNLFVANGARGRVVRFRAPPAPTMTVPPFTNRVDLAVTGVGEPDALVDIVVGQTTVGTQTNDAGAFTATVNLAPDRANVLTAYLTTHRGDGLSSAGADVATIHDGIVPAIAVTAPAASAFVRGVVDLAAQASDAGSGVATLGLTVDGRTLPITVTPSVPAATVSAVASWDTTTTSDGAREVIATVADRAGNVATARRTLVVDNTPPETVIVTGPTGEIQMAAASVTFAGTDALTPAPQLQFAWRLDSGAWAPFSPATRVDLAGLAEGAHRFEVKARDLAGNEDPTAAARDFTVRLDQLRVVITEPAAGATITAGFLIVRGVVSAAGTAAVDVNGILAQVQGTTFAALIPVTEATTSVTATAVAGASTASAAVPISVAPSTAPPMVLIARPAMGVAPLTVTFSVLGAPSGTTVSVDADGDGIGDELTFTYTRPGLYVATAAAGATTASAIVEVLDRAVLDAALQGTWGVMKDALRAGNVEQALQSVVATDRDDYRVLFDALMVPLASIDTVLRDIALVGVGEKRVEYQMLRVDNGVRLSYFVLFVQDVDGVWRLKFF